MELGGQAEEGSVPSQLIRAQDLLFHLNYCFTLIICFNLIIGAPAKVKQVGTISPIFHIFQLFSFNCFNSIIPAARQKGETEIMFRLALYGQG